MTDIKNKIAKKANTKTAIITGVTIAMLVIIFLALGRQIRMPWPLSVSLDKPTDISAMEGKYSFVDSQNTRFCLVNDRQEVDTIFETDPYSANGERFITTNIDEDGSYYATATFYSDSSYVQSEQVYFIPNNSRIKNLIYSREYDKSQKIYSAEICGILTTSRSHDVVVAVRNYESSTIEIISVRNKPGEIINMSSVSDEIGSIYSVSYNDNLDEIAFSTISGEIYRVKKNSTPIKIDLERYCYITDCCWSDDNKLFCIDSWNDSLLCVDPYTRAEIYCDTTDKFFCVGQSNYDDHIVCGTEHGATVYNTTRFTQGMQSPPEPSYSKSDSFRYSLFLIVWTIVMWIAIIYVAVLVLVILIKLAKSLIKNNKSSIVKRTIFTICAVLAIIGVSVFYTAKFYNFEENKYLDNVGSICSDITKTMKETWSSQDIANSQNSDKEQLFRKYIDNVGQCLNEKCVAYAEFNTAISFGGIMLVGDQYIPILADSQGYKVWNYSVNGLPSNTNYEYLFNEEYQDAPVCDIESGTQLRLLTAYQVFDLPDSNISICLKTYLDPTGHIYEYVQLCINMVMTLLAIASILLLVIVEIRAYIISTARKRRAKKVGKKHPEIWRTRQLAFLINIALCFDATMGILIAKEILITNGFENADIMAGLPAMFMQLGLVLGYVFFGLINTRISTRKICIIGCVGATGFFVLAFWAVLQNNFLIFCIAKSLAATLLALIDAIAIGLPLRAGSEENKAKAFSEYFIAAVSGTALAGILGGYISQYIGNCYIYLSSIIPCFLILIICISIFTDNSTFLPKQEKSKGKKSKKSWIITMLKTPSVIMLIITIMLPMLLMAAYQNILFPLYMDNEGIPKSYINNIVAFAIIIVFAITPPIQRALKNIDSWKISITCVLIGGAVFLWFTINQTIAWAIFAIIPLEVAYRVNLTHVSILNVRQADYNNISETKSNNALIIIRYWLSVIPAPLMSGIAAFGKAIAGLILGGVCVAAASLFGITTRRSAMRTNKDSSTKKSHAQKLNNKKPASNQN